MGTKLQGKRIAILATDGFEQSELEEPKKALESEGAKCHVVSLKGGTIKGWKGKDWGTLVDVDVEVGKADPMDYDALVLPGGVINPDLLRIDRGAVAFVRSFVADGRTIGAICHGPWTLVDAEGVRGKTMTSYPSIRQDLVNAGANWIDEEVVVDAGLVTSRKPSDIPAFNRRLVEEIAKGVRERRPAAPTAAKLAHPSSS